MATRNNPLLLRRRDIRRLKRLLHTPRAIYGYLTTVLGYESWVTVYEESREDTEPSVRSGLTLDEQYNNDGTGQIGGSNGSAAEEQETFDIRPDLPWKDDAE